MKAVAILWDQSFLWGLFLYDALYEGDVSFDIVNSGEIRAGALKKYKLLIVPGGWASQKIELLGDRGASLIRDFIYNGGRYIGFCGGAGMVLTGRNSLGIVPVGRLPLEERLPSASGQVLIEWQDDRNGLFSKGQTLKTSIWWPAQFKIPEEEPVNILATYCGLGDDFWVSDIVFRDSNIDDIDINGLEKLYGINLDPFKFLLGRPAVIEYVFGKGKLFLSYPHLETPGNLDSRNFLFKLVNQYISESCCKPELSDDCTIIKSPILPSHVERIRKVKARVEELVDYGMSHFLWYWRTPWLLGWRRGIRGLEYSMLFTVLTFLYRAFQALSVHEKRGKSDGFWNDRLNMLDSMIGEFCEKAFRLVKYERFASMKQVLPKLGEVNDQIDPLRKHLFGSGMNHGGICREIFNILDDCLFHTIKLLQERNLRISFANDKNDFTVSGA